MPFLAMRMAQLSSHDAPRQHSAIKPRVTYMTIRFRHQKVPIRVKISKLNFLKKNGLWYGSKKGLEYLHMILMNIFMEENPRVTYIEKKLERVTLNFQRVTLT